EAFLKIRNEVALPDFRSLPLESILHPQHDLIQGPRRRRNFHFIQQVVKSLTAHPTAVFSFKIVCDQLKTGIQRVSRGDLPRLEQCLIEQGSGIPRAFHAVGIVYVMLTIPSPPATMFSPEGI